MNNFGLQTTLRVLETRSDAQGLRYRRYMTEDDTTFWTVEIPREVWRSWAKSGRHAERFAKWKRARLRDRQFIRAKHLGRKGWKATAIAHEIGVPERTIRDWLKLETRRKHMVVRNGLC